MTVTRPESGRRDSGLARGRCGVPGRTGPPAGRRRCARRGRGQAAHDGRNPRGLEAHGLAPARSGKHAVPAARRPAGSSSSSRRISPRCTRRTSGRWCGRDISTGCRSSVRRTTSWSSGATRTASAASARRARRCRRSSPCRGRPALPFTRLPDVDGYAPAGRFLQRLPGRRRSGNETGLARALLRHGRRRAGQRDRQRQRSRTLCRDRQRAAPARPQHRARGAGGAGHGTALDPAARHGPARLLREAGAVRADHERAARGRRARRRARPARGHAHRHGHLRGAGREPAQPERRLVQGAGRATSNSATCRSRCGSSRDRTARRRWNS